MNQHLTMPHISVESPVTHNSWEDGKYTTYDIIINCEEDSCPLFALSRSSVSRRYREFRWLRKRLCSVTSPIVRRVPQLPTVGCPLFDDRFSPDFIENRKRGLETFLQGVCALPTLLSEAALHLFVQTDLSISEIDAYVERKWGRREEVYDVIISLNQQKQTEERDEIASLASVGRWSEASGIDIEDDLSSNDGSATSSVNNQNKSVNGTSTKPASVKKSQPRAVMAKRQVVVADAEVISPVLGLYLPPDALPSDDGEDEADTASVPVVIRATRGQQRIASSVPIGLDTGNRRQRSRSVQIQISNDASSSISPSSYSPGSYQTNQRHHHLSSSLSPNGVAQDNEEEENMKSPTSVDIYNRRRRGKSPAPQIYCSNAVWLSSSAANTNTRRSPRRSSPATFFSTESASGSQATSSLSPPSSATSPTSSLTNGGRH